MEIHPAHGIAFSNEADDRGCRQKASGTRESMTELKRPMIDSSLGYEGQTVTIKPNGEIRRFSNYLSTPGSASCMEAGITDDVVVGFGPYKVTKLVSGETMNSCCEKSTGTRRGLRSGEGARSDGDTLTMSASVEQKLTVHAAHAVCQLSDFQRAAMQAL